MCSWWGLVLAEMCLVLWVTLCKQLGLLSLSLTLYCSLWCSANSEVDGWLYWSEFHQVGVLITTLHTCMYMHVHACTCMYKLMYVHMCTTRLHAKCCTSTSVEWVARDLGCHTSWTCVCISRGCNLAFMCTHTAVYSLSCYSWLRRVLLTSPNTPWCASTLSSKNQSRS